MHRESNNKSEITLICEYCGNIQTIPLTNENSESFNFDDVCLVCNRHSISTPYHKFLTGCYINPDFTTLKHSIFPFVFDIIKKNKKYELSYLTLPCYIPWIEQSYPDEYKDSRLRAIRLYWWVTWSPSSYYTTALKALEFLGVYKRYLMESKSEYDYLTMEYCVERNRIDKPILEFIYKTKDAETKEEQLVIQSEVNKYIEQELKENIIENRETLCVQVFHKIDWELYKLGKYSNLKENK